MFAVPYALFGWLHQAAIDARRKDRRWTYLAWSVLAGLTAGLTLALGVMGVAVLIAARLWPLALAVTPFLVLPVLVPWLLRHLVSAGGWTRVAYQLGLRTPLTKDRDAAALVAGAWALARRPDAAGEAWLCDRRDRRAPLGDAEIIATALVAAGRGDHDGARAMLRAVPLIVEDHPDARELGGEWLACDAAERGAWRELADDARAARWPATPLTLLLEGVAARHVGAPGAPGALELWARWLLAPRRRATWPLVIATPGGPSPIGDERDATAGDAPPPPTKSATGDAPAPDAGGPSPVGRALAAHLALGDAAPLTAAALDAVIAAWDAALDDDAALAWLAERARALDAIAGAPARVVAEVAAEVAADLAGRAERAGLPAGAGRGPVGQRVARHLRHGRLDALEAGFTAWQNRRHDGAALAAIDEWREFVALRAAYLVAAAAGGPELRRLAFPRAYLAGNTVAVWLWNGRKEYALSHAITCWLREEAIAVGDAEAIELTTRNARLDVPTRLGTITPAR